MDKKADKKIEFRKLIARDIDVKVKQVFEKKVVLLLYKTARTDMDILDETVGAEKWMDDYREIKGNLYCGIGIDFDGKIVWKWDCGIESRADNEGNQKKGEASDAFKRAGFKWGIGRELYTSPKIVLYNDKVEIKEKKGGNGFVTYDTFHVEKISYTDGAITGLSIKNQKDKRVFVWQLGK